MNHSSHSILNYLKNQLPNVKRFFLAYSGGLDSHVLLHQLQHELANDAHISLHAIHINHQLNRHSETWVEHCQIICEQLMTPLKIIKLEIKIQKGDSLEENARKQRYDALSHFIQETDCLLTAHHQDDQAETLLLQLFRGAGPKGLSAMPSITSFGKGFHARPFLMQNRDELLHYAKHHQLKWIEDDSNQNQQFDRNYLRHQVMPLIKERWPSVSQSIARSARLCAQSEMLVSSVIQESLKNALNSDKTLSLNSLRQFDTIQQAHMVRYWLCDLQIPLPSEKKISQIIDTVIYARMDANPCVKWRGGEIRRYRDQLYAFSELILPEESLSFLWDLSVPLLLPNKLGTLVAKKSKGKNLILEKYKKLTVRFNKKGLDCKIPGRSGTKSLKNLFQEWGIPVWERACIPLLFAEDKLISIVGYTVCEPCTMGDDELGWRIELV